MSFLWYCLISKPNIPEESHTFYDYTTSEETNKYRQESSQAAS